MQRSVYENWIESLTERQFDGPFITLLQAHGFFDIHFTHGPYEFGKDFVAKRRDGSVIKQYGFQTKAGNIGGSEWSSIQGQLDELTADWLVHPNYNTNIPREHRLVLTGELHGKAILSAKQYKEKVIKSDNSNFEIWDKPFLLDLLEGRNPLFCVIQVTSKVEALIGKLINVRDYDGNIIRDLETTFQPPASATQLQTQLLHIDMIQCLLWKNGQHFHSYRTSQYACKTILYSLAKQEANTQELSELYRHALSASINLGLHASKPLLSMDPADLATVSASSLGRWAAYPACCSFVCETLSYATINALIGNDQPEWKQHLHSLIEFIERNPGCYHPLSDRYSPATMFTIIALCISGKNEAATEFVRKTVKWVCDQLQDGLGLAGPYSDSKEEVERIFCSPFDFSNLTTRKESYLSMGILDACYILIPDFYQYVINDFMAVECEPAGIFPYDTAESIFQNSREAQFMLNVQYPETASTNALPHHQCQSKPRLIETVGGHLAPWIVASTCCDRLITDTIPRLARERFGTH